MILRWWVFGWEVWCLELSRAEADEPAGITGGPSHDFERDLYPPSSEEPYEDRLGFS